MFPIIEREREYQECWMCGCSSRLGHKTRFDTFLCRVCRDAIERDEHDYVTRCVNALTMELLEIPFEGSPETAAQLNYIAHVLSRIHRRQYQKLPSDLQKLIYGGSSGGSAAALP